MNEIHRQSEPPANSTEPAAPVPSIIVGVRFMRIGKIYHFDASAYPQIRAGDRVIVETTRGRQVGEVVTVADAAALTPPEEGYKPIEGIASPRELLQYQMWQARESDAIAKGQECVRALGCVGVKVIRAEYSYDGSRLAFMVCPPDDAADRPKFDLDALRDKLQTVFSSVHVTVRQIGARDAAKIMGGMGACGLEMRCCALFLTEFCPVSIKMAKEQRLALNPEEITGMCGRLRCCMVYEYEQYAAARKTLPKRNKQVVTPQGMGKVVDVDPLKETVFVKLVDGEEVSVQEFPRDLVLLAEEADAAKIEALKQKIAVKPPVVTATGIGVDVVARPAVGAKEAAGGQPAAMDAAAGAQLRDDGGRRRRQNTEREKAAQGQTAAEPPAVKPGAVQDTNRAAAKSAKRRSLPKGGGRRPAEPSSQNNAEISRPNEERRRLRRRRGRS